jgi:hypothetical protein
MDVVHHRKQENYFKIEQTLLESFYIEFSTI